MQSRDRWDDRPWLQRAGDSLSQLLNVWLANGMPDESLSGRSYRNTTIARRNGEVAHVRWWIVRWLAELLFWPIDRGRHGEIAWRQDISRAAARLRAIRGIT